MEKNQKDRTTEEMLLKNNPDDTFEQEFNRLLEEEIKEARELAEKKQNKPEHLIETDFLKLSKEEKFDRNTIYKIFNRIQKTETFVNGEQAENLIKYTDKYIVRFDHRIIEN